MGNSSTTTQSLPGNLLALSRITPAAVASSQRREGASFTDTFSSVRHGATNEAATNRGARRPLASDVSAPRSATAHAAPAGEKSRPAETRPSRSQSSTTGETTKANSSKDASSKLEKTPVAKQPQAEGKAHESSDAVATPADGELAEVLSTGDEAGLVERAAVGEETPEVAEEAMSEAVVIGDPTAADEVDINSAGISGAGEAQEGALTAAAVAGNTVAAEPVANGTTQANKLTSDNNLRQSSDMLAQSLGLGGAAKDGMANEGTAKGEGGGDGLSGKLGDLGLDSASNTTGKGDFTKLLSSPDLLLKQADSNAGARALTPAPSATGFEAIARTVESLAPAARTFVVQTGVAPQVGQPQWSQAVGERVLWLAGQNISTAELRLDPPELGPMQVRVSVHQDQVQVNFTSPHAGVREALDQGAARLREMFNEQGLNLNLDVSDQSLARRDDGEKTAGGRGNNEEAEAASETALVETEIRPLRLIDHYA